MCLKAIAVVCAPRHPDAAAPRPLGPFAHLMTAANLLALISAALLLQLAAGVGWTVWRWRTADGGNAALPTITRPAKADVAWAGWRGFRVVQRRFEDADQSQCSFYLQPIDGQPLPPFKPGQFLTFGLDVQVLVGPHQGAAVPPATRAITRCYSLSDQPDPAHYRVTIKRVPAPAEPPGLAPGLSSSHFHDEVQVGSVLRVKAPAGQFFIDTDASLPVVLIAGGIGITPMMSMLSWCMAQQPQRRVHLYYGLRQGGEMAFKPQLEAMAAAHPALQLHVVFSRPGAADLPGHGHTHTGRVDVDLLRRTLPPGRHLFYVCGPPAMMQTLVPALAEWGVPAADIHHEAFGPASVQLPGTAEPDAGNSAVFDIRFQRSGRTLAWDGRDASLLDFAERQGIVVDSGCRSGGCGSCETRLLQGTVTYAQAPDHDVAAGHCLLCVGRPSSTLVLAA